MSGEGGASERMPLPVRQVATEAQARALASVVRLRILRVCLHEPHSNREIAQALGLHPATALHHVRRLVATGFLAAEPARPGPRRARAGEVPYLATRLSWRVDDIEPTTPVLETFLADIDGLPADVVDTSRLGFKLSPERLDHFRTRLAELMQDLADEPSDPAGEPWSIFVAIHPDQTVPRTPPDDVGRE